MIIDLDYSLIDGLLAGLKPDPILTVAEWAEHFRKLPQTSAEPGSFRNSRTPYLIEIAEKLSSHDPAQRIIFQKSSQVGATELGNNWVGYTMDISPCGMLYIMPTDSLMKLTSKTRIQPMIDSTPPLRSKVAGQKSREGGNTILTKEFQGGFLNMIGANSPVGLSSVAVKRVYCDETDRYPMNVGDEGDVISLAETRTSTFGATRKLFLTSTPTIKGQSIINYEFLKTGQRYFNVPCPHCGSYIVLQFSQLRYDPKKLDDIYYECQECGSEIKERSKTKMLINGQWKAKYPELEDGITFGYHINALYSPLGWYSWLQMARDYENAKGNIAKMITWVNTKDGEVYEAEGDAPQWEAIYNKREEYQINKPNKKVLFLTAGVDIQRDRIELEIVGWGLNKESWSVDYRVLIGKTDAIENDVWQQLSNCLIESWTREDGAKLNICQAAVDSGYNTQVVYQFSKNHLGKVIPTKGNARLMHMVSAPKAVEINKAGKKLNKIKVWHVGVDLIKSEIYGSLSLQQVDDENYPAGYCHFPQYDSNYFKGLTAEKLVQVKNKKGYTESNWIKHFDRNEPLDCRVYARAAAHVFGIDRWSEKSWQILENNVLDTIDIKTEQTTSDVKTKTKSDFWGRR